MAKTTEKYVIEVSENGIRVVNGQFDKMHKKTGMVENGLKNIAIAMGGIAAAKKAIDFSVEAKNAARDAQEISSKFNTVFKSIEDGGEKAFKSLANSYGLASSTSKEMLSDTGDLLTGLDMTSEKALELSYDINSLAIDLASFTNYSGGAKGASEALTKALLGERESAKALGIIITENMVKEQLAIQGKEKLTGTALLQAKAEATLKIAINQSKNAVGDYARTQNDLANIERRRKEAAKELREEIGNKLTPVFTTANTVLTEFFKTLTESSLETTVRHLQEMGVAAKELQELQRTVGLENAFETLLDSTEKVNRSLGMVNERMQNVQFAERSRDIMKELGQTYGQYKINLDASAVSSKMVETTIRNLASETEDLSKGNTDLTALQRAQINDYRLLIGELSKLLVETKKREASLKSLDKLQKQNNENTEDSTDDIGNLNESLQELQNTYANLIPYIRTFSEDITPDFDITPPDPSQFDDDPFTQWLNQINSEIDQTMENVSDMSNLPPMFSDSDVAKIKGIERITGNFANNMAQSVIYGQDFGDAMVNSLKAIAAEMASKAALFLLLSAISGGSGGLAKAAGSAVAGGFGSFVFGLDKGGYPQEPKYMNNGGFTAFVPRGQDKVPAMIREDERVMTRQEQTYLNDFLKGRTSGGSGSSMTVVIQGDFIGSEENADKLAEIIADRSDNSFNRIMVKA